METDYQIGNPVGNFVVTRRKELPDIDATLYAFTHLPTEAQYIHISRADSENTFGVAFKTVPTDSTGAPHILEHTVLCGSEKFPVRDPFFSMIKRSLHTFMNAFTASDWTMYPFSTQNKKDFYNLMDVYLDAAFFPRIERLSFLQEGYRLEVEDEKLVYKGVVYNEMKGALSSPDQILYSAVKAGLYPDVSYRFNSGGVPEEIRTLTYEELKAFHAHYYHPTNAFFYSYGNLPVKDHFAFIEKKVLSRFEKSNRTITIDSQPHFSSPKQINAKCPIDTNERIEEKNQVCIAWLTSDIAHSFDVLVLTLLEQILLGNPAAPLRKALLDSKLGSSLCDVTGYMSDYKDTFFACGLKDVSTQNLSVVKTVVENSLRALVKNGIDEELIAAAIHQMEFYLKEVTNSPYPYGLRLLLQVVGSWISNGEVADILLPEENFKKLSEEMKKEGFFERQISTYLLENPHRIELFLILDPALEEQKEKETQEELATLLRQKTKDELLQIEAEALRLNELQDEKENLDVLPTLELSDVPPDIEIVSESPHFSMPDITIYEKATSGILYLHMAVGIGALTEEEIKLLPFLGYVFTKMGTQTQTDVSISRKIDLYTGGISLSPVVRNSYRENLEKGLPFMLVQAKALRRNIPQMIQLVADLMLMPNFIKKENIQKYLSEYRAKMESGVVQNGHRLAMLASTKNLSSLQRLSETISGFSQLRFLKQITSNLTDAACEQIGNALMSISSKLFSAQNMQIALTGSEEVLTQGVDEINPLQKSFPSGQFDFTMPAISLPAQKIWEGASTSTSVSFVGASAQAVTLKHPLSPVLSIAAKMLKSLFLHREIREKGGAYGGFSAYNSETGIFGFGSYRDPHIARTLETFREATHFFVPSAYTQTDLKEAILQVCADLDKPSSPAKSALRAFERKLIGLTDEERYAFKESLLQTTKTSFQNGVDVLFEKMAEKLQVSVISSREKLDAFNGKAKTPLRLYEI